MWINLLVLAIAVNFEPTRMGLLPLLLSRKNPLLQIASFLGGGLTVSLGSGLLFLFILDRHPFIQTIDSNGIQVVLGAIVLGLAAIMAFRWVLIRRRDAPPMSRPDTAPSSGLAHKAIPWSQSMQQALIKSQTPWIAAILGGVAGLPSVDFLAVLVMIASDAGTASEQALALVVFLLTANLVTLLPLLGFLVTPAKTQQTLDRFSRWAQSRSPIEYAAVLAALGVMLIAGGFA